MARTDIHHFFYNSSDERNEELVYIGEFLESFV